MKITDYLKENLLFLDGGTGTLLQKAGLKAGEKPETWNISHPDVIINLHKNYYDSGSNVVCTNTFGANVLKFSKSELEKIISAAVENAKKAKSLSNSKSEKFIALDIGPTGKMLKPYGDLDFEEAVGIFSETVKIGAKCGVDLIFIETMNDSYEAKAALLAAKESCSLPVFVSCAYGEDGKLLSGTSPEAMIATLEGLKADAIGVNCSFGPEKLRPVVEKYLKYSSLPVLFKPNAGLPKAVNGKTVYDLSPEDFSTQVLSLIKEGVKIAGGCCGTTPDYIKALTDKAAGIKPIPITKKNYAVVSSYTHAVTLGEKPVLIGERINPTGKKKLKEALLSGDMDYILKEGIAEQEKGADVLDVNVGLLGIDEKSTLKSVVSSLQAVTDLPLQIDTADTTAMENALRIYNGKAMINSVNGKKESMKAVFPLVKKYGGIVICLTLDENGIPKTAEERFKIAKKIISTAKKYGIDKKELVFDALTMAVSADANAARETLKAVKMISEKLGAKTSLGVSNVSFGLPKRDILNSAFFTAALNFGLSCAIINPFSVEMMKAYHAHLALTGKDENFISYTEFANSTEETVLKSAEVKTGINVEEGSDLQAAVTKGLKSRAAEITKELLKEKKPMDIISNEIIPALDKIGVGFENKTVYLPQLLMSAEAAKAAFSEIKNFSQSGKTADKCKFVIATVKGDIHDIGKNIVKLLLENYGFDVTDLGRDVPPKVIVDTVVKNKVPICGLSALMTTTVPAMEETIKLLRKEAPWCKIAVGGAVLNKEYAQKIGADFYAKDAMETVRYAEKINSELK